MRAGEIAHVADDAVDMPQILVEGGNGMLTHLIVLVLGTQPKRPVM